MEKYLIHDFAPSFAREPVIRLLKSGKLICSFLSGGTTEPQNANVVLTSVSGDGGKTWTDPKVVVSHSQRGCWATEIFTETEKPFIAVHTYNTNDYRVEHYRELQTFRQFIDDDGNVIGEPVSFTSGLNGVSLRQGVVMSNGEWIFPLYWQEVLYDFDWKYDTSDKHAGQNRYPFRCGVAVSGDNGFTFQRYGYLYEKNGLWEPNLIELENGHIMMLMRPDDGCYLYRADSYDYGRTWTKAAVTDILNPHTKPTLFKIDDTVFLINNFSDSVGLKNRNRLQIRSTTDGKTWKYVLNVTGDEENFFYPHAAVDYANRVVYVAYENAKQHYLAKIGFDELF